VTPNQNYKPMTSLKKLTILAGILAITSCKLTYTNLEGGAYIVESAPPKSLLKGPI